MKKIFALVVIGFLSGVAGAITFYSFFIKPDLNQFRSETGAGNQYKYQNAVLNDNNSETVHAVNPLSYTKTTEGSIDFTDASLKSTPSVVYIKTTSEKLYATSWLEWFFGEPASQTVISSGSGVIYTSDGYVVTNNHVIENSNQVEIIFDRRTYPARIVGADPSTDLAVLKIDANNLSPIQLGSSKNLRVGEWVIAVGNPFNLTSTVTAGIVSAKGRQINILKGVFPIESFIQTDAAINPGNSGGALVNIKGELVGINTAILSKTGSYAGYGFAVPVDIVNKVVKDIIDYGEVQKAFFGADVVDIDENISKQWNIDNNKGVLIQKLQPDGAAGKAGLAEGDILISVNGENIDSRAGYEEVFSHYSPGDKISVKYKRNNEVKETNVILTNSEGTTSIIKREIYTSKTLGADFELVSKVEREMLGIPHGIKIVKINPGLIKNLDIEEGFIVTYINRYPIKDAQTLVDILSKIRGKVIIEGVNSQGTRGYYSYIF